jgi:hypothetical protein
MAKKAVTSEQYRHFGAYERLRRALLEEPEHERLNKPLAYWVLPSDRRLPMAFLDIRLGDLLSRSLDELMGTPGVGQKKIGGLITLLKRALRSSPVDSDFGLEEEGEKRRRGKGALTIGAGFDPAVVSEELWSRWRDTVKRCGITAYTLGRLAPSLQTLPTVIWHTRLDEYVDYTLEQVRNLRTHGEKRVHAILEVFCGVHEALATATLQDHLEIVLQPKFVPRIAHWVAAALDSKKAPSADQLHDHLAKPLLSQVETDLGKQIAKLSSARVSLSRNAPSVRTQAKKMGVTRARVYQLLDDCGKVMDVRWPEGRWLLAPMGSKLAQAEDVEALGLYRAIMDLFYPQERAADRAAAGAASGSSMAEANA